MKKHLRLITITSLIFTVACAGMFTVSPTPTVMTQTPTPIQPASVLYVAYIKDGNVWLWIEGQGTKQITHYGNVLEAAISDDGLFIAFKRDDELYAIRTDRETISPDGVEQSIWLMNRDYLHSLVAVNDNEEVKIGRFEFGPGTSDQRHSVFLNTFTIGGMGNEDLFRVNADTGIPVRVFPPGQGGRVNFSLDGQWIAFSRPNQLVLSHSDGTELSILEEYPPLSGFGTREIPEIIWDQDGFLIITPRVDPENRLLGSKTLFHFGIDGTWLRQFDVDAPLFTQTFIAPNGNRVAYFWDHGDLKDLHIVDVNNDSLFISYPSENIGFIGWAPDSERFVLWIEDRSRGYYSSTPLITRLGGPLGFLTDRNYRPETLRWVDNERFLFVGEDERLFLESCNQVACKVFLADIDSISFPYKYYFTSH